MSSPALHVVFDDQLFPLAPGDSVLDALLKGGVAIPYGCRAGACHSCLLRTDDRPLPASSQRELTPRQIELGCFLSCQLRPQASLSVQRLAEADFATPAEVVGLEHLSPGVLKLSLAARTRWQAGQYFTVLLNDDTARCYSPVASSRHSELLEFHIRYRQHGGFSGRLPDIAHPGATLRLQGPFGHFTLRDPLSDKPTVFIAQGTGLSPILALLEEWQLSQHNANTILLAEGIEGEQEHYLGNRLATLGQQNEALTLDLRPSGSDWIANALTKLPELQGAAVYICGHSQFVAKARKACFMRGASPRQIHSEIYLDFSPQ